MLECTTCIRQCIRVIFADVLDTQRLCRPSGAVYQSAHRSSWIRRGYTTQIVSSDNAPFRSPGLDAGLRVPYVPRPIRPVKQDEPFSKTSLEQEVRWLKDPLKLGDHTVKLLRQDDVQKALAIVRLAGKDMECTVSWNYLIDYHMSKGKVTTAVKLYNEMKKRAQLPDAHTFTTLLRGFSWNPKFSLSVSRALSIYHSMFTDNSPVKPSIIHTNAVLRVCALAGDMDALLGVAAKLPSRGSGAPDNITFTTILNAIRSEAWDSIKGEKMTPGKREKQTRAVMQGRRLWEEIRQRWAKGDLHLDEELVCAMGRLMLLANDEKNCDDILSLLEQTMGIARQVPRIGEPGRRGVIRNLQAFDVPDDSDLPSLDEMVPVPPEDTHESENPFNPDDDPFAPLPNGVPKSQAAVKPGRNALSLILDACVRVHMVRAAQNYWGILTDPSGSYNISPDTENYHMYLRLLRVQRASRLAVELVDEMRQGKLGPRISLQTKTFRIALSCCVRDKKNRDSLAHAAKLVRLMNDTLEVPDARALGMYVNLALSQQPLDWRTLTGVIRGAEVGIRNLRSLLAYDHEEGKQHEEDLNDLVKACIGAMDVAMNIGEVDMPEDEKKECKRQRMILSAWITRIANKGKTFSLARRGQACLERKQRQQPTGEPDDGDGIFEANPGTNIESGPHSRHFSSRERRVRVNQRKRKRRTEKDVASSWQRFVDE